jgi:hypothetical protein
MTQAQEKLQLDGAHDFDFLPGRWRIHNHRLRERLMSCEEWDDFEATSEARLILGGTANMDEYFTDFWPGFVGGTLRLYNAETGQWSLYWMTNKTGTLEPPVVGSFKDGVGIFEGPDMLRGQPITVQFIWSNITPNSARWEQRFSPDNGQMWETNWIMESTRIK